MQIVVCVYCIFFPNELEEVDFLVARKSWNAIGSRDQEQWNSNSPQLLPTAAWTLLQVNGLKKVQLQDKESCPLHQLLQPKVLCGSALPGAPAVAVLIFWVEWSLNKEFKSLTLSFVTNSSIGAGRFSSPGYAAGRRLLPSLVSQDCCTC